jgi:hypothetical protein
MRVVIPRRKRNNNHEERNVLKEVAPLPMVPEEDAVDSEHKDYTKSSSCKLYSDPATAAANATAVLAAAVPGAPAAPPMAGKVKEVQIVTAAVAYDDPTTYQTYVLFFHQVLYIERLGHHLLCPAQLRANQVTVN